MASYDVWKLDCPPENKSSDFEVEREEYLNDLLSTDYLWSEDEPWEEDLNPLTAEDLKYLYN